MLGGGFIVATEMVACAEFARGRPDVVRRAAVGEGLPLTVIQLVGRDPEAVARGAALAEAAGADLIDLNMGCPAKEVTGALSGSALMRDLDLATRLIAAAVRAYAIQFHAGRDIPIFGQAHGVTATDTMVVTTAMLKAVNIQLFELGMWQMWAKK